MRISDWSSDVCSSDLSALLPCATIHAQSAPAPQNGAPHERHAASGSDAAVRPALQPSPRFVAADRTDGGDAWAAPRAQKCPIAKALSFRPRLQEGQAAPVREYACHATAVAGDENAPAAGTA